MVTTLIEWDTMSCSSRAIRVRSSARAVAASSSASRSSRAARATASSACATRLRSTVPTSQGPTKKTLAAARSLGSRVSWIETRMNGTSTRARPA